MTLIARRILDIAERLPPDRQQALLDVAENLARPAGIFDPMASRERTELDRAEASRGEIVTETQLAKRLPGFFLSR